MGRPVPTSRRPLGIGPTPHRHGQTGKPAALLLLWAGVAGPVFFTLSYAINEALRPHFNLFQQSITVLAEGPDGWVQRASFVLFGLTSLAFALGLGRLDPPPAGGPGVARCEAGIGAGLILAGLLVQQPLTGGPHAARPPGFITPYGYVTLPGLAHVAAAVMVYVSTVTACLLVAQSLGQHPAARRAAAYSRLCGWLYLALIAAFAIAPLTGGPAGLFERIAGLVAGAWTVWFAWRTIAAASRRPARSETARPET